MTTQLPETLAQFHARVQPKDGDKFVDDRGQVWISDLTGFCFCGIRISTSSSSWDVMTCPLKPYVEPKKTKMWPCLTRLGQGLFGVSQSLFVSEEQAKDYMTTAFVFWPAIPGPDGSYEVPDGQN